MERECTIEELKDILFARDPSWGMYLPNVDRSELTFAVETHETLPNAALLLDFENAKLRDYAASLARRYRIRAGWQRLKRISEGSASRNVTEWGSEVLSTDNRLTRFLISQTIKRFMGLTDHNLNLMDAMEQGTVDSCESLPVRFSFARRSAPFRGALSQ